MVDSGALAASQPHPRMNIVTVMNGVVDAQLRLQFLRLGRDMMLPSVMASDPAHDPKLAAGSLASPAAPGAARAI